MQNADGAVVDGRAVAGRVQALSGGFDADQAHAVIVDEFAEHADRIAPAAHAGDDLVRQATGQVEHLGARLA